ncbi:MAG TPA: GDP-L-fucose synthase [Longimicrobium sp.]|nr:GDP-L-fucose synthase [Longimicrobium sp.]
MTSSAVPEASGPPTHPEREPGREFWAGRRVLVTGGGGFLGSHLVERLQALGAEPFVPRRAEFDLTRQADVERLYAESAPRLVMHLAAEVGGIGANRASPGRFFYANAIMGVMMIEEARRAGVEKFVQVGTVCAYPKYTRVPFREEELWAGYPEETNAPYGIAKKALLVQLQAYRQQYGMDGIYLLPTNLYGPRDNFDPATSHVIPALVRRMAEARRDGAGELRVWGTGNASREFLYVDDAARALLLAAEHYDGAEPVNIGIGNEIRIAELARLIASLVGYEGRLAFDPSQPDGQPRRSLDTRRARELFGFQARVGMREGLRSTIDWYLGQHPG